MTLKSRLRILIARVLGKHWKVHALIRSYLLVATHHDLVNRWVKHTLQLLGLFIAILVERDDIRRMVLFFLMDTVGTVALRAEVNLLTLRGRGPSADLITRVVLLDEDLGVWQVRGHLTLMDGTALLRLLLGGVVFAQ